jgi:hypothetical protein
LKAVRCRPPIDCEQTLLAENRMQTIMESCGTLDGFVLAHFTPTMVGWYYQPTIVECHHIAFAEFQMVGWSYQRTT